MEKEGHRKGRLASPGASLILWSLPIGLVLIAWKLSAKLIRSLGDMHTAPPEVIVRGIQIVVIVAALALGIALALRLAKRGIAPAEAEEEPAIGGADFLSQPRSRRERALLGCLVGALLGALAGVAAIVGGAAVGLDLSLSSRPMLPPLIGLAVGGAIGAIASWRRDWRGIRFDEEGIAIWGEPGERRINPRDVRLVIEIGGLS